MKAVNLSPRLKTIASLVPTGSVVVDVGTDHAYIPAWLLINGVVKKCFATDINSGPLELAARNLSAAGVLDACELILCDGLAGCGEHCADTVIIAGMGGDNIAGILERAPWTKHNCALILQPMSKAERLRRWLCVNGFSITSEQLVRDSGKIYPILTAKFLSEKCSMSEAELYIGRLDLVAGEELFSEFISEFIGRLERAVASQKSALSRPEQLDGMKALLESVIKMKEEALR